MTSALGPGAEFDAIRAMVARWGAKAAGIGDDGAVLSVPAGEKLIASTDTSVENVHFRREWLTPREIGWRATMAALSDLAAMGARPLGLLSALTMPTHWRSDLRALSEGIGAAAEAAGCAILGGDLNAGTELSIGITVLGSATAPILRAGARAGDALWVTGALGGPGAALRSWLGGSVPNPSARDRFVRPEARIAAGVWLRNHGCGAAIDVSDGLVADARHIAAASDVALTILLDTIPCFAGVSPVDAASSGEEYELLVSGPASLDAAAFQRAAGISLSRIGSVAAGAAGVTVLSGGARVEIGGGHDHFSS